MSRRDARARRGRGRPGRAPAAAGAIVLPIERWHPPVPRSVETQEGQQISSFDEVTRRIEFNDPVLRTVAARSEGHRVHHYFVVHTVDVPTVGIPRGASP